ncbi:MAG TPA: hypothetical protein ENN69_02120 [Spirochaetia bacterium]|nr:hypothetical protein [Spirochaetia bacterium]
MGDSDFPNDEPVQHIHTGAEEIRDTDLSGMDKTTAFEYVVGFATTLKETERARRAAEEDLGRWKERIRLAEEKNETKLAAEAVRRSAEIETKLAGLKREETSLRRKVSFMKDELHRLQGKPELSLDPEALLAQFEMVLGEPDTTLKKIKEEEAALELEKLKRKMADNGDS